MTKNQAIAMAEQLAGHGMKAPDITKKLAEAGYVSDLPGKAVSAATVYAMLAKKKRRKKTTVAAKPDPAPVPLKGTRSRVDAVKAILRLHVMSAEERVALALLILE